MTSALILGYSAFDLGLFNDKDIRVDITKTAIRRSGTSSRDGWFGLPCRTLGFEYWALPVWKTWKQTMRIPTGDHFDFETMAVTGIKAIKLKWSEFSCWFCQIRLSTIWAQGTTMIIRNFCQGNTDTCYLLQTKKTKPSYDIYQMMKNQADYVAKKINIWGLEWNSRKFFWK